MALTKWLIDKSALVRIGHSDQAQLWVERIERGLVHISGITLLEVGFSSRSGSELRDHLQSPPLASMPVEYLTPAIEERALVVQMELARRGHHRGPSVPDLLLAANAEMAGLVVLHVDHDFEVIADQTGQAVERLT